MLSSLDVRALDAKRQLLDLDRVEQEESLYEFLKGAWPIFDSAPWVDGWCIDAIAEHLQAVIDGEIKRLCINVPPRCSKSALCSVALTGWTWAQKKISHTSGPGVSFLYASYREDLSRQDSVNCRKVIESQWYKDRWGDRFALSDDQNTKSRFDNDKGGYRLITSVESKGSTGFGANCFVAGTPVSTPIGQRKIEDLRIGDPILAFDTRRGKMVQSRVLATSIRKANDLCTLYEVSGHRFVCTPDHPVYSPGRGFICAGEMGKGDRLLITDETPKTNADDAAFNLRELRKTYRQASISAAQSVDTEQSRCVLRRKMSRRTSRDKKSPPLRAVWREVPEKDQSVLFATMQIAGASVSWRRQANNLLWHMWNTMQDGLSVLLKEMREQRPLPANEGRAQLEVPWERQIFESVSKNASRSAGARRRDLHGMYDTEQNSSTITSKKCTAGSPYRRQHEEQRPGEFTNVMREMSQEASSWRIGNVERVSRHCEETHDVYDIQVEGHSNFFADGILVHNCIILDDCNSAKEVESEAITQSTLDWFDGTLGTRLNNQKLGAVIEIQQRVGELDLTGHIQSKDKGEWTFLILPMRFEMFRKTFISPIGWSDPRNAEGDLLWPERFGEEEVKGLETWMGPWRAAGQLQQRPEPKGGGIIKRAFWRLWEPEKYPAFDFMLACLDTAYTESTLNDPSGLIIWGVFSDQPFREEASAVVSQDGKARLALHSSDARNVPRVFLVYAWDRFLELHDLVTTVEETCRKYEVDLLLIENKASGISVAQEMRRMFANSRFSVQLFDPKSQDKISRLISVENIFADGLICAPTEKYPWVEKVISQVERYPKSKHDEYVDLTSMGLRYLRDAGLICRVVEREAELEELKAYRRQEEPLYPV